MTAPAAPKPTACAAASAGRGPAACRAGSSARHRLRVEQFGRAALGRERQHPDQQRGERHEQQDELD